MGIEKTLTIKLTGDAVDHFKSAVKILVEESGKIGFMKMPLTEMEIKLFKQINDILLK